MERKDSLEVVSRDKAEDLSHLSKKSLKQSYLHVSLSPVLQL